MPIASDLEKLVSPRDRGDLSQAEFEEVKERLLSGGAGEVSLQRPPMPPLDGRSWATKIKAFKAQQKKFQSVLIKKNKTKP